MKNLYKTIGGKNYEQADVAFNKTDATKKAESYRKRTGRSVRTIKYKKYYGIWVETKW